MLQVLEFPACFWPGSPAGIEIATKQRGHREPHVAVARSAVQYGCAIDSKFGGGHQNGSVFNGRHLNEGSRRGR